MALKIRNGGRENEVTPFLDTMPENGQIYPPEGHGSTLYGKLPADVGRTQSRGGQPWPHGQRPYELWTSSGTSDPLSRRNKDLDQIAKILSCHQM